MEASSDNIGWHMWVGTIVTAVPATAVVIARFFARTAGACAPGLAADDWLILASMVTNWAMAAVRWYQVIADSYGRHADTLSDATVRDFQITFLAVQEVYFLNAVLTKGSLLYMYYRIFGVSARFTKACCAVLFLVVAYFILCVVLSVVGCHPVSFFWNKDQAGWCINEVEFFRWNGISNVLLDVAVLSLPLPMVWGLNVGLRRWLALNFIFMLGLFVCLTSVIRIVAFNRSSESDPTYTTVDTATWSSVEQSVGIVCACLPALAPLFSRTRKTTPANNSTVQLRSFGRQSAPRTGPGSTSGSAEYRQAESMVDLGDGKASSSKDVRSTLGDDDSECV